MSQVDTRRWSEGQLVWADDSDHGIIHRRREAGGDIPVVYGDLCQELKLTYSGYIQPWIGLNRVKVNILVSNGHVTVMKTVVPSTLFPVSPSAIAARLEKVCGHVGRTGEFLPAGLRIGRQHHKKVLYIFVRDLAPLYEQLGRCHKGLLEKAAEAVGVHRVQLVRARLCRPYVLGISDEGLLAMSSCRVLLANDCVVSQEEDWIEHDPLDLVTHMTYEGLDTPAYEALLQLNEYRAASQSPDAPDGSILIRDYARLLISLYNQGGFEKAYSFVPIRKDLDLPEPYTADEIHRAVQATQRLAA